MSTQRTRLIVATFAAVLAATFALAPSAHADRRSSLSGNLLIKDTDDMFFFPHTALEHVRLITFDLALAGDDPSNQSAALGNALGAGSSFGNAGIVFGSEATALGLFTHRSDNFGALVPAYYLGGDIDELAGTSAGLGWDLFPTSQLPFGAVGGGQFVDPLQWIDLLAAFQLGASPLGFRLSVGHNRGPFGSDQTYDDDGDIYIDDSSTWAFNGIVGYGIRGALNLDLSAEIGYGTQDRVQDLGIGQDGDIDIYNATGFNFSAMARGFSNMARGVDLGFTGLLFFRSYSSTYDPDTGDGDGSDANIFGLDVGAGPLYHIDDQFNIAAHATLGFQRYFQDASIEADPEDDDGEFTQNNILVPGLKLSGEYRVFEWLWLRTGAQYFYQLQFLSDTPGEDIFRDTNQSISGFRWVSGIGINWQSLELNGTFNAPFMLSGPNFIGGGSGMFAHLNVQYRF